MRLPTLPRRSAPEGKPPPHRPPNEGDPATRSPGAERTSDGPEATSAGPEANGHGRPSSGQLDAVERSGEPPASIRRRLGRPLAGAFASRRVRLAAAVLVVAALMAAAARDEAPREPFAPIPSTGEPGAGALAPRAGSALEYERRFRRNDAARISAAMVAPYRPLYRIASRSFGVDWRLIASVHKQETAFSTSPDTYHGLNFAGCCAGPMQFNVRNGPVTTWDRFKHAHRRAPRPAAYPHPRAPHPSPYDDFDAIMAAASLLASSGAARELGAASWGAAYDYYGHDATGVLYASQVLARALMWERDGFCPACEVDPDLLRTVSAAYAPPEPPRRRARRHRRDREAERADRRARKRAEARRRRLARVERERRRRHKRDVGRGGRFREPRVPPAGERPQAPAPPSPERPAPSAPPLQPAPGGVP